jgi:hypothetical protein
MKTSLIAASLACLLSATACLAQTSSAPASASSPAPAAQPPPPKHVLFSAPEGDDNGILPNNDAGGSRGGPEGGPELKVLVPPKQALTTEARPLLYWYQSRASTVTFEVGVSEPRNPKPLMLMKVSKPTTAGVHSFRVTSDLKPGTLYRWSVALVVDPTSRSADIVASGVIKRIDPPADLVAQLQAARDEDKPALYAQHGIWYDALESLSTQIRHAPDNDALKQERASLLKQVGLDDIQY